MNNIWAALKQTNLQKMGFQDLFSTIITIERHLRDRFYQMSRIQQEKDIKIYQLQKQLKILKQIQLLKGQHNKRNTQQIKKQNNIQIIQSRSSVKNQNIGIKFGSKQQTQSQQCPFLHQYSNSNTIIGSQILKSALQSAAQNSLINQKLALNQKILQPKDQMQQTPKLIQPQQVIDQIQTPPGRKQTQQLIKFNNQQKLNSISQILIQQKQISRKDTIILQDQLKISSVDKMINNNENHQQIVQNQIQSNDNQPEQYSIDNMNSQDHSQISFNNIININNQDHSKVQQNYKNANHNQVSSNLSFDNQIIQNSIDSFNANNSLIQQRQIIQFPIARLNDNDLSVIQKQQKYDIKKVIRQYCKEGSNKIHGVSIRNMEFQKLEYKINKQMSKNELKQLGIQYFKLFKIQTNEQKIQLRKYKQQILYYHHNYCINLYFNNSKFWFGELQQINANKKGLNGYAINITANYTQIGSFINGLTYGNCLIKYKSGNIYDGQCIDSLKQGYGKFYNSQDQFIYQGQFQDDTPVKGRLTSSDNQYYQGTFKKQKYDGFGYQVFQGGSTYKVQYMNDVWHGKGKLTYKDGGWLDGNWIDGQMNGEGYQYQANGSYYKGSFRNNLKHGNGKHHSAEPNQLYYDGEYLYNKKNGFGILAYANGDIYEGLWEQDLKQEFLIYRHGKGKLKIANGQLFWQIQQKGKIQQPSIVEIMSQLQ